jgi:hypothetical protein
MAASTSSGSSSLVKVLPLVARELPSLFTANLFIEQPPDAAAIKTMAASWRIDCMGIILSQYKKIIIKIPQRFSRAWTE